MGQKSIFTVYYAIEQKSISAIELKQFRFLVRR